MADQVAVKKVNWLTIGIIAALVVLVVILIVGIRAQRKIVALTELSNRQTERLDEFTQLSDNIRTFNRKYGEKYGRLQSLTNLDSLNSDLVQLKAKNPNAPSDVDSLIEEFSETAEKIAYLSEKIDKLEKDIGTPHVVKSGDSHANVAKNYLTTEAGLTKEEADKILKRTALVWDLAPGNYVYNLYYNDVFLTTVTQGTSKISPLVQQRSVKRAQESKLAVLQAELDSLRARLGGMTPAVNTAP